MIILMTVQLQLLFWSACSVFILLLLWKGGTTNNIACDFKTFFPGHIKQGLEKQRWVVKSIFTVSWTVAFARALVFLFVKLQVLKGSNSC